MRIVGRDTELEIVDRFLSEMASGTRALFLEGEAGIGKSTIWQRALTEATDRGYRVIRSRPTEAEARLPFAGLSDLFGGLLDGPAELPEPMRRALEVALLRATHAGPPPEPLAISLAVLSLTRAAVRSQPLLIAVDDVPWLDDSSASALAFAARRLDAEPVGLLVSQRTSERASSPPAIVAALSDDRVVRIRVEGLVPTDIDRLLGEVLGLDLPPSALARLHKMSGGNPFYAVEIGRALQRRGPSSVHGELPMPDSLADLIRDRLSGLSPTTSTVIAHAAALSHPTRAALGAALGPDVVAEGLAEAATLGVVVMEADDVRFTHPLLAAEAYGSQPEVARRQLHRRLADVVLELEEQAKHLALAAEGPDADVAMALELAAEHANQRGAPDDAAQLAEQAASLTPGAVRDGHERIAAAAHYHFLAGDVPRSRELLEAALPQTASGLRRAGILARLAEVRFVDDWALAERMLREALRNARGDVRLTIRIKLSLAGVSHITGRSWSAGARHAADAMRLAEELGDPDVLAGTIGHFARWDYMTGHPLRRDLMQRAAELEPFTAQVRTMDHPDFDFASILWEEGDWRGSCERIERLSVRAERVGDYSSLSFLLANMCECDVLDYHPERAAERLERADRLVRTTAQQTALAHVLAWRVFLQSRLGDADGALSAAEAGFEVIAATGWGMGWAWIRSSLAQMELSRGDPGAAHEHLNAIVHAPAGGGNRVAMRDVIPIDVEALVGLGRLDEAQALLGPYERIARSRHRVPAFADALRARGLLLAASGDVDEASKVMEEALRLYVQLGNPWELARHHLLSGEVHRRARRRAKAAEAFSMAADGFDRLGARMWAARARSELDRNAGRRHAAHGLTPTQLQVAELVTAGRTNREVAGELFMSRHTVEAHLTSIYRSFGIRSRAELGRVLRDSPTPSRDSASRNGPET